ncbi:hypothetical protein NCCP28_29720 [Niallia sp. NCCP-28]|nr:hypothetical protein NCCP28_29720 [Niallia sp. NCCP-28]
MDLVKHPFFSIEKKEVEFVFDNKKLTGYAHQTIAGALLMNGIYHLADSKGGNPRGVYSYEPRSETCYVLVNKKERVLASKTLIANGMMIERCAAKPKIGRKEYV